MPPSFTSTAYLLNTLLAAELLQHQLRPQNLDLSNLSWHSLPLCLSLSLSRWLSLLVVFSVCVCFSIGLWCLTICPYHLRFIFFDALLLKPLSLRPSINDFRSKNFIRFGSSRWPSKSESLFISFFSWKFWFDLIFMFIICRLWWRIYIPSNYESCLSLLMQFQVNSEPFDLIWFFFFRKKWLYIRFCFVWLNAFFYYKATIRVSVTLISIAISVLYVANIKLELRFWHLSFDSDKAYAFRCS